ncbi:MAG: PIN domain nuclease [Actinomycetota bacterium]
MPLPEIDPGAGGEPPQPERERSRPPGGRLVESVRLIFVLLFAAAGYTVATRIGDARASRTLLGVVLGTSTGFVLGGVLGRQTVSAVSSAEQQLRRVPASEVVAGMAGLIVGLAIAALSSVPIFRLPPLAAWTSVAFMYMTLGYAGYRIGRTKNAELFDLIGLKPRAAGVARGEVSVIDTSALIDGRVVDLVSTGFLSGDLLIHSAVLRELQAIADSSDPRRRGRGRRGLDAVAELQRAKTVDVHLVEEDGIFDVDAALVRLARDRGASLITADHNLSKVAQALSVPVPNLNQLAAAFRTPVGIGDELVVELVKDGREHGQAVGYLEDGTMVVVEEAGDRIGAEVPIQVRNVIQTATGRMVFAVLR